VDVANLLEHEQFHDLMLAKRVPKVQVATFDIAAWDLHARMLGKPLHALLGTKRTKVLRYGDVRGLQPDFSPQNYARSAARYLDQTGMLATKLHFPGAMGTADSISFPVLLETLQAVRQAVGKDKILAYDPCARGLAESATNSVDEAKQILKLMDELNYSWIEGPLPPMPYETQIPKYVELVKTGTKQRIQAEGPGSPIGDNTPFEDMRRWAEAGAITQCSTDAQWSTGVTNCLRCLEHARLHPPLVINLHYSQPPHVHLLAAIPDRPPASGIRLGGAALSPQFLNRIEDVGRQRLKHRQSPATSHPGVRMRGLPGHRRAYQPRPARHRRPRDSAVRPRPRVPWLHTRIRSPTTCPSTPPTPHPNVGRLPPRRGVRARR
jgi:hypothetical protein